MYSTLYVIPVNIYHKYGGEDVLYSYFYMVKALCNIDFILHTCSQVRDRVAIIM